MGFFSNLFRNLFDIEKQLEKQYVSMLQTMDGLSLSQAKSIVLDMLKEAKAVSEKERTSNLPSNFGDILLTKEPADEKVKSMLTKLRSEGVTDKDIKWWWNMHDLERRMLQQEDLMYRGALFLKIREENKLNVEDAVKRVGKSFPIFGDPDDSPLATGKDRPLPYELKDRINIYVEKIGLSNNETLKKEIDNSSSFNSWVREKIKKGYI